MWRTFYLFAYLPRNAPQSDHQQLVDVRREFPDWDGSHKLPKLQPAEWSDMFAGNGERNAQPLKQRQGKGDTEKEKLCDIPRYDL